MKSSVDFANQVKVYTAAGKSIAPVENGETAVGSYEIGDQFMREGVLYKAKTDIDAGDSLVLDTNYELEDDVTTQLSSVKQALTNEVSARAELGAHNLLNIDIAQVKSINTSGTWTGDVYNDTTNGITWTISHTNGQVTKITANGTTSTFSTLYLQKSDSAHKQDFGNVSMSTRSEADSVASGYRMSIGDSFDDKKYLRYFSNQNLFLEVDESVSNFEFYPMICLDTDLDTTYQPYAMTNKELTPAEVNFAFNSNFVNVASSSINAFKIGNILVAQFSILVSTSTTTENDKIAEMSGYKFKKNITFLVANRTDTQFLSAILNSGEIITGSSSNVLTAGNRYVGTMICEIS